MNTKFQPKLIQKEDGTYIWDTIRRKYVVNTPEEYVRQFLVYLLADVNGYPSGLFSLESGIRVSEMAKRYDLLVNDRSGAPFLLAECKSPEVKLGESALNQVAVYNSKVGAPYILLFNGSSMFCWERKKEGYTQLQGLPSFPKD